MTAAAFGVTSPHLFMPHSTASTLALTGLICCADYAVVLNKAALTVGLGNVSPTTVGALVAAYIGLVVLAVFINSLSLRLPLIYYKQRRSKVHLCQAVCAAMPVCLPACLAASL